MLSLKLSQTLSCASQGVRREEESTEEDCLRILSPWPCTSGPQCSCEGNMAEPQEFCGHRAVLRFPQALAYYRLEDVGGGCLLVPGSLASLDPK